MRESVGLVGERARQVVQCGVWVPSRRAPEVLDDAQCGGGDR
jgi:hypothetical protein